MKVITRIINTIFLLCMLGIAGLFLLPYLPFDSGFELRIVESGSMEPAITTGSLTMVLPAETYQVGDVIMFSNQSADVPTTHRIVDSYQDSGKTWLITKGDANEEADNRAVPLDQVMGAVVYHVPRVGFVLDFARQPVGFLLLIVLPSLLIILSEVEKIWSELRRRRTPEQNDDDTHAGSPSDDNLDIAQTSTYQSRPMMDIATPARYFAVPDPVAPVTLPSTSTPAKPVPWLNHATAVVGALVFSTLVVGSSFLGSTVSYFNDMETSLENRLDAIALDVRVMSDGQNYTFVGQEIEDGNDSVVVAVSPENDSVDTRFNVTAAVTSSSTNLCDQVEADAEAPLVYQGPLSALSGLDVTFTAPWSIAFSLLDETSLSDGDICEAELTLTAWHHAIDSDSGYFDIEIVPLLFTYIAPTSPASSPTTVLEPLPTRTVGVTAEADTEPKNETGDEVVKEVQPKPESEVEPKPVVEATKTEPSTIGDGEEKTETETEVSSEEVPEETEKVKDSASDEADAGEEANEESEGASGEEIVNAEDTDGGTESKEESVEDEEADEVEENEGSEESVEVKDEKADVDSQAQQDSTESDETEESVE